MIRMGKSVRSWKILVLLATFTVTAVTGDCAGEHGPSNPCAGNPEWPPGDKLMLSLRVARAMKDVRAIARYKSLVRQRRLTERRPFGGDTAPPFARRTATGRHPPWGR